MLVIDSNLSYLQRVLNIDPIKFQQCYSTSSIDEILEAEAACGNQKAIELAKELTTNVNLVMELFDLADTNNKYQILRQMSEQELFVFLLEMDDNDLLQGLYFFTQDKLLKMMEELPSDQ